jgi:ClpX C4-type zinc finger
MSEKENEGDKEGVFPRYPGWCSYCRKNHRDVGPLVEGSDQVYICYQCVRLCAWIIEEECRRRGTVLPQIDMTDPGSDSPSAPRGPDDSEPRAGQLPYQPPPGFEYDKPKRVLRLLGADGRVEVFRDQPTRYLVVSLDPKTGDPLPITTDGVPRYLYLCREEREER